MSFLRGYELETSVCGNPSVDLALLKALTESSAFPSSDPIVPWLWEILEEFTQEDRKAYLRFVWGRSRLPLSVETSSSRMRLQRLSTAGPADTYLPVAHTCSFAVDFPAYSSKKIFAQKLKYAMTHCQSIEMDGGRGNARRGEGVMSVSTSCRRWCLYFLCSHSFTFIHIHFPHPLPPPDTLVYHLLFTVYAGNPDAEFET